MLFLPIMTDYQDLLLSGNIAMASGFSYNSPAKITENIKVDNMSRHELIRIIERQAREIAELHQQLQAILRDNERMFAILKRNGLV
jgi:hypothetical protein